MGARPSLFVKGVAPRLDGYSSTTVSSFIGTREFIRTLGHVGYTAPRLALGLGVGLGIG